MYYLQFLVPSSLGLQQRFGCLDDSKTLVVDLTLLVEWSLQQQGIEAAARLATALVPPDTIQFLQSGSAGSKAVELALDMMQPFLKHPPSLSEARTLWLQNVPHTEQQGVIIHALEGVTLACPLTYPGMFRDFMSFEQHMKDGSDRRGLSIPEAWFQMPVYYKGNPRSFVGPEAPIFWPDYTQKLDFELEWACVIGKKGRNIPVEKAADYIVGYTVLNDFSARDIQLKEMTCRLGPAKGKDFATALGPWIVTPDALPIGLDLTMTARINGDVWSQGQTGSAYWGFEQMIAHVSQEEWIYPGDVFGSGTVGRGCGLDLNKWIQPGDVVELEVEGIGVLRNEVVDLGPNGRPDMVSSAGAIED